MAFICDFRSDIPPYKKSQLESFNWLAEEYSRHNPKNSREKFLALLLRVGAKPAQVEFRGHYLPEFSNLDSQRLLFKPDRIATIQDRMRFFGEATQGIFNRLFKERSDFEELLHVTCTGYNSPSSAQKWVLSANAEQSINVSHIYHMGCYAALPALKLASALNAKNRKVEICHTELCTLHLNPLEPSLEDFVVQTLFADGACAYRIQSSPSEDVSLNYLSSHEEILPNTQHAMSWSLHESGFKMTLSKDVPALVKKALPDILSRWLKGRLNLKDPAIIWAIHPGGPKVINEIRSIFDLTEEQVSYSLKVLKEHGNMSSATLPHIWQEVLNDNKLPSGTPVLTMAFGPGLTVSLAHLEVVR